MQSKILILAINTTLILTFMNSCKHHEENDTEKPVITIKEPLINDTISLSASAGEVHVEFTVTDNDELHDVDTKVTDLTGSSVLSKSAHVDASTYSYHEHFKPTGITGVAPFTLKIEASDHNSNVESKTVTFYVMP